MNRGWWAALALAATLTGWSSDASALLWENDVADDPENVVLVYFYPYRSVFWALDPGYAFDDDPLTAFVHEPYDMPVVVRRAHTSRMLVQPRTSFIPEMSRSTDVL